MNKVIVICLWLICFAAILDEALRMISEADTAENIMGFCLLMLTILISAKTKCFTNFKNKKNEKSN